ncbi:hypothetical protein GGR57DRAFT_482773 [Xylariaceae sp. FL1272]|nr:hypothetical protein GGR57DRAFT_482773 [Xylariaceae sp. FL1272]
MSIFQLVCTCTTSCRNASVLLFILYVIQPQSCDISYEGTTLSCLLGIKISKPFHITTLRYASFAAANVALKKQRLPKAGLM